MPGSSQADIGVERPPAATAGQRSVRCHVYEALGSEEPLPERTLLQNARLRPGCDAGPMIGVRDVTAVAGLPQRDGAGVAQARVPGYQGLSGRMEARS